MRIYFALRLKPLIVGIPRAPLTLPDLVRTLANLTLPIDLHCPLHSPRLVDILPLVAQHTVWVEAVCRLL